MCRNTFRGLPFCVCIRVVHGDIDWHVWHLHGDSQRQQNDNMGCRGARCLCVKYAREVVLLNCYCSCLQLCQKFTRPARSFDAWWTLQICPAPTYNCSQTCDVDKRTCALCIISCLSQQLGDADILKDSWNGRILGGHELTSQISMQSCLGARSSSISLSYEWPCICVDHCRPGSFYLVQSLKTLIHFKLVGYFSWTSDIL